MKKNLLGLLVLFSLSFLISCGKDETLTLGKDETLTLGKDETLTLISYGPKEIHANQDFNIQADGVNAFWMNTKGATSSTIAVFDGQDLISAAQADGTVVTAAIPKKLFQAEGSHQLYLLDKKTQIKSNTLEFLVKK